MSFLIITNNIFKFLYIVDQIIMIFLLLLWTINITHYVLPLELHKIENEANLMFINEANISIADSYKIMEIKINMDEYLYDSISLKENINNLMTLCSKFSMNSNCKYFKRFIEQNINNTEALHKEKRRKRFWSELYDYFFGDCYELDQETIDRIQRTDKENRNLTSNHVMISNNTLQLQQTLLNNSTEIIKNITKRLYKLETKHIQLNNTVNINNLIQMTITAISEINRKSQNIINLIYNEEMAKIIEIIDLKNMELLIYEINKTLHKNEQFYSQNPIGILNSAYSTTEFRNQTLFVKLKIPIKSESNNFEVYKIIPLPFRRGRATLRVKSDNMNILNNTESGEIFITSDFILDKCKIFTQNELICSNNEFSYSMSSCETDIFLRKNTTTCTFEPIMAKITVTRLFHNIFYCVTDNRINFTINCEQKQNFAISHSIWFLLEPGCTFKIGKREFFVPSNTPQKLFNFKLTKLWIPEIKIEQILESSINDTEELLLLDKVLTNADAQYKNISEQIKFLYFDSIENIDKIQISEHGNKYNFLWLIIAVILGLVIFKMVLCYILKLMRSIVSIE